jgi:uncharacterized membrane protein SirB2
MKSIKDFLLYTAGMAIVVIFAASVFFGMWLKEKFQSCKTCKIK